MLLTAVIVIVGVALIFDFINGFHDAANSIATVVSTRVLVASAKKVQEAVGALRLIKKPQHILTCCRDIKDLERQADEIHRTGVGRLFKSGADPLTVIKWKEILDTIETATDKCLGVANVVEAVVLEHS